MNAPAGRRPKDRDFLETPEGLIFCVVGYIHPPDRYLAYLKYTPADAGKWARGDLFYRRELPYYHVRHVRATLERLERDHPRYVWLDPASQLRFSFVPTDAVARYYVPEARLAEILSRPADPLETDVRDLVTLLARATGLSPAAFGITGSILLGLHNAAFSDIDLLVYGAASALAVRGAVGGLAGGMLTELPPIRRAAWRAETAERFALAPEDLAHLERRRWNYLLFRDRYLSIHPTRSDAEIGEAYGQRRYTPVGPATIEATVADATESLFLPAVYGVEAVSFRAGIGGPIRQVLSFEALYGGLADAGDRIVASGLVETDQDGTGRLVVGTARVADGGWIRVRPRAAG